MSPAAPRAGAELPRRTRCGWIPLAIVMIAATAGCDRPPPATVEVWLGGDVHLGGAATTPEAVIARLAPLAGDLRGLGLVNLEGPAGESADVPPSRLANHPTALRGLRAAGVLVVGLANNHARDGGADPAATAAAARTAGLVPAGLDAGAAVITRGGVRVVVAAHTVDDPALATALHAARRRGDVLVVGLHVVATPSYLPGPALVAAVETAVAAGAAVVVVHGSHALARVERRGRTVIAWGLGNLLFSCDCTAETDALILQVTLGRDGVRAATIVPIAAGIHGAAARRSAEPDELLTLLRNLGSTPLQPAGPGARLAHSRGP